MDTVLVVDDERFFRTMVADFLAKKDFRVLTAEDGEQTLQLAEKEKVDAVVLDIVLPGIDGIEVLRQLKMKDFDRPVIMVTGTESLQNAIWSLKEGAFDYFRKPVNLEELHHSLTQALEKYRLTLENKRRLAQLELFERGSLELTAITKKGVIGQFLQSRDVLLEKILDLIAQVLGVEIVSLMMVDEGSQELRVAFVKGLSPEVVNKIKETPKRMGEGIAGYVAKEDRPLLIKDLSLHPSFKESPFHGQYKTKSLMSVPLKLNDRVIGVLNANNRVTGETFTEQDFSLFKAFSHVVSLTLTNAQLYERLTSSVVELAKVNRKMTRANLELKRKVDELDAFRKEVLGPP